MAGWLKGWLRAESSLLFPDFFQLLSGFIVIRIFLVIVRMERGKTLERMRRYPLSDSDVRHIVGQPMNILAYPELGDYDSIESVFNGSKMCLLLFPTISATSGHWTCLLDRPEGIEFFDPYGDRPESQKRGMGAGRLEQLDMDQPYLHRLIQ